MANKIILIEPRIKRIMEIVKYLCEFFFTDFWHFLGLLLLACAISDISVIRIRIGKNKERED